MVATFELENFSKALDFVNTVAVLFEKHNHHPDVGIYDYKFVTISTTTHDAGHTITQKDYDLVGDIEDLLESPA